MSKDLVVQTKLCPPATLPSSLTRDALISRMREGTETLVAIIAPTGWGKTQLLAHWIENRVSPTAFVRLDKLDNDPVRFWAHVLASLEAASGVDLEHLRGALRASGIPLVTEIVIPLVQALSQEPLTLVLDDFHLVTDASVQESIEALIDYAQPGSTVVICSRNDAALHLARRRVRQEVLEIRLADLRVNVDEAAKILSEVARVELDRVQVEQLVERTEGWPAGLYLAGLSLRSTSNIVKFVESFAGDDHNISEFLATEVLDSFDEPQMDFLLNTSVLDQMDAASCQAMTAREDSGRYLNELSHMNHFVVQLDASAGTYRYHHLFRDWLQLELSRRRTTAVSQAHRTAADFFASQSDVHRAMAHAIAGSAWGLAYELIFIHGGRIIDEGGHATLSDWIQQFPQQTGAIEINLNVVAAWLAVMDGDPETVIRRCREADRLLDNEEQFALPVMGRGEVALVRAYGLFLQGDLIATGDALEVAGKLGVSDRTAVTFDWLGEASRYWLGAGNGGKFGRLKDRDPIEAGPFVALLSAAYLAHCELDLLRPDRAQTHLDRSFALLQKDNLGSFGYAALSYLARARIAVSEGQFERAMQDCERAIELSRRRSEVLVEASSHLLAVEILHALEDKQKAQSHLRQASQAIAALPDPGILAEREAVVRRQLRLPVSRRPVRPQAIVEPLTDREMSLLRILPGDLSQRDLGRALHVSFNTIKTYNRQIYRKLGVTSRDDAIAVARAHGLL